MIGQRLSIPPSGRHAVLAAIGAFALASAACSGKAEVEDDDNLIYSGAEDAAVTAAEQQAVKFLPVFWAKFDARQPGVARFLVKVGFDARAGGREYLWAAPLRRSASQVQVRLVNEPIAAPGLKAGAVVDVAPADIVDWTYTKDGKAYGHFTTRALMSRATPEQRAEAQAMLAPTPLEPETK